MPDRTMFRLFRRDCHTQLTCRRPAELSISTLALLVLSGILLAGCTGVRIPDQSLYAGEISHVLTRQEILTGNVATTRDNKGKEPVKMPKLREFLVEGGFKDEDISDGTVALVRTQFWWWNTGSGIVRQFTRPAIVPKGVTVAKGNVVEVKISRDLAFISRVRYQAMADGSCDYRNRERGSPADTARAIAGAMAVVGSNGAVSFYCPSLEKDGWKPQKFNFGEDWIKSP